MPTAQTPTRSPQRQQREPHARHRAARERAARKRRLTVTAVIGTGVLLIVIVIAALLYNNANGSSAHALSDAQSLNPAQNKLAVGTTAPDFTLATVDGKQYHLASLRGHPVLLEFFAVWC